MTTSGCRRASLWLAAACFACGGCAPGAFPAAAPQPAATPPAAAATPVQTRKTVNQTTQNVLELSRALAAGGVLAETSIQGGGLAIAAEAYRTQVGKAGTLAVEQKMRLYQAEHGELPKTFEEFMTRIIGTGQPDGISLPMLPYYQEWAYDAAARKLVVVEFPAKREQRQKETTGAAGL